MARCYFLGEAGAGLAWWIAVFVSDAIREATLGTWSAESLVGPDPVLFVGASVVAAIWGARFAALVAAVWTSAVTIALGSYRMVERAAGWGVVLMAVAAIRSLASAATIVRGELPTHWFFVGPFSFKEAAPSRSARHLRRSLAQLVLFWTTFFVVIPFALAWVERRLKLRWTLLENPRWTAAGVVGFGLGSALGLWSYVTMALRGKGTPLPAETASELVVKGPYRYVRNPMAVAGVLQTVCVGLWLGAWMVVAIAIAGDVAWNMVIRPAEERDLAARFGDSYRRYSASVRCWVPALARGEPNRAD